MLLRSLFQVAILFLFLLVWQTLIILHPSWGFFCGSPIGIFDALLSPSTLQRLPEDILVTAGEATSGFVIGTVAGTVFGLLLWLSSPKRKI